MDSSKWKSELSATPAFDDDDPDGSKSDVSTYFYLLCGFHNYNFWIIIHLVWKV